MKYKLIFAGIIGAIFVAAMVIYKDTMTLKEIALSAWGAIGSIIAIWKWISVDKLEAEAFLREKENENLRHYNKVLQNKEFKD